MSTYCSTHVLIIALCVLSTSLVIGTDDAMFADVQTAVVAKEALEGHCIYDGGSCKLHISYSRHTDLSIKVIRLYPLRRILCYVLWLSFTSISRMGKVVSGYIF